MDKSRYIHGSVATWQVDLFSPSCIFKPCIEPYSVFLFKPCFIVGCRKKLGLNETIAVRCNQGKIETTKNLLQIHISSMSFLDQWEPWDVLQWTTKSRSYGLWNSKRLVKKGPIPKLNPWKSFRSLCNVLLFWLHVKMLDFWKTAAKFTWNMSLNIWGMGSGRWVD